MTAFLFILFLFTFASFTKAGNGETFVQYDSEGQCTFGTYVPNSNHGRYSVTIRETANFYQGFISSKCKDDHTISAQCIYNEGNGIAPTSISIITKETKCPPQFKCRVDVLVRSGMPNTPKATCVPKMKDNVGEDVRKCMVKEALKKKRGFSLSGLRNTCAKIVGSLSVSLGG